MQCQAAGERERGIGGSGEHIFWGRTAPGDGLFSRTLSGFRSLPKVPWERRLGGFYPAVQKTS